jgi:hypothetical protein
MKNNIDIGIIGTITLSVLMLIDGIYNLTIFSSNSNGFYSIVTGSLLLIFVYCSLYAIYSIFLI